MSARDVGTRIGAAIGEAFEALGLGRIARAALEKRYGKCRVCEAVLSGPSDDQSCGACYAGEQLAKGFASGAGEEPDA